MGGVDLLKMLMAPYKINQKSMKCFCHIFLNNERRHGEWLAITQSILSADGNSANQTLRSPLYCQPVTPYGKQTNLTLSTLKRHRSPVRSDVVMSSQSSFTAAYNENL